MTTVVRGATDLWEWSREQWDPALGLVANPPGGYSELGPFAGRHLIRETAWFALDALAHVETGIAVAALRAVLNRQYDRPGQPWHGTFPIFEHDPEPGDDAIMWLSYDPNWRQFVGVALAVIVGQYTAVLPTDLVRACEDAVRRCVEGEPRGRIDASYTNPALMHAWLADWVGRRFQEPSVAAEGLALAESVMALFEVTRTLGEFNSPTYDGVNLLAASLWAGAGEPLRTWGRTLLDALFDSMSFLYHPGLRNLSGPYTRTYGMDLGSRITLYGLWRLVARSDLGALPALGGRVEHSHDLFFAPLVEAAVRSLPRAFPADDLRFPRHRSFALSGGRTAEAFLDRNVMIGAEQGGREALLWDQYVPGSVHWRDRGDRGDRPDGAGRAGVGWLRVHASEAGPVDCHLSGPRSLTVVPVGDAPIVISTNAEVVRRSRGSLIVGGWVGVSTSGRLDFEGGAPAGRIVAGAGAAPSVTLMVAGD